MALFEVKKQKVPSNLLVDRFIVPPFSVFNTSQSYWQERKRNWISMGIKSELGRGENLTFNIDRTDDKYGSNKGLTYNSGFDANLTFKNSYRNQVMAYTVGGGVCNPKTAERYGRKAQQTSIFDPVLCEIAYKWFTRDGDTILDPFAGGSVRGMIAGILGKKYFGIDLSEPQICANKQQYIDISAKYSGIIEPTWIIGDSINVKELVDNKKFNFIFSCPPYYNLEVYSTLENDLSNKSTYDEFLCSYRGIIKNCCDLLEYDSFAVFVVGNLRNNSDGGYYDLSGDTIRAFKDCGLIFYNEAIIVNVAGTLPVRTPIQFNASRKLGKQHQNFLVFYKGNPKNIKEKFGSYEKEEKK